MAEKYEKNGYNSSDFKRNSNQNLQGEDDPMEGKHSQEGMKINDKAGEYLRHLLGEKIQLNNAKFPMSYKLIDQEVAKVQATGRIPIKDSKYLDVYREKPAKVTVKVLVPVKEFPKFNFVGKLLGPKGNTMKYLQEETMCKMAVLGRGSMRDRQKEEELRNSLDPKYAHLTDELHVEISAQAPPAEAHARVAYALAEVKKYLIPDANDMIRQNQMRDIMERGGGAPRPPLLDPPGAPESVLYSACTVTKRSFSYQDPVLPAPHQRAGPPGRAPPRMAPAPPTMGRPMPPKTKVISILDRARSAMESSYSTYDDPYASESAGGYATQRGPPPRSAPDNDFYYERNERYYDEESYYKEAPPAREFKASARDVGTRRAGPAPHQHYARATPYARPPK
ncbi:KH domain-containing, RNA-binding, signal transduction-associated protein 3-like isoform X2 [Pectinophora gossypiella]|nr:KH domain-containing, RNA-binding, signal transduction-associated protein 3-like isoform X2 [Pectinophora gossypiella]XP_049880095.1 KH domain-containing, RNA-binding, signal transduction-associated protein 3-like isoform X2 [Pectinophora gossypiella]